MTDTMRTHNIEQYQAADAWALHVEAPHAHTRLTPYMLVADGAEAACALLRLARHQPTHSCLTVYVQQQPTCVVLDLDSDGSTALVVCRTIRAQPEAFDVVILLMTSQMNVRAFDAALLAGADEILLDPLPDAELLERVENALHPKRHTGPELRRRCERLCQQRALLAAAGTHSAPVLIERS